MGTNGMATAVALAGGIGDLGLDGELQPDMFEPEDAPSTRMLPAAARSGPKGGRPKGSRNRSTEERRRYLLSRYQSPLVGLLEMCARTPRQLAEELELYRYVQKGFGENAFVERVLDIHAAVAMQMDAQKAALPYLEQRQPLAIEAKGEAIGWMVIGDLGETALAQSDGLALPVIEHEGNQQVSDAAAEQSDEHVSDESGNSLASQEKPRL